jgi:hypothetical protein
MNRLLVLATIPFAMAAPAIASDAPKTHDRAELHAAMTDIPVKVDMSHADPLTWHSAPGPVEIEVQPRDDGSSCAMLISGPDACTPMIIAMQ